MKILVDEDDAVHHDVLFTEEESTSLVRSIDFIQNLSLVDRLKTCTVLRYFGMIVGHCLSQLIDRSTSEILCSIEIVDVEMNTR